MQRINCESADLSSDDTAEQGDACPSQPAEGRQEEEEVDAEVGQTDLGTHDWLKVLLPRTRSRTRRGKTEEEARPQAEGEEEEQMQGPTWAKPNQPEEVPHDITEQRGQRFVAS